MSIRRLRTGRAKDSKIPLILREESGGYHFYALPVVPVRPFVPGMAMLAM